MHLKPTRLSKALLGRVCLAALLVAGCGDKSSSEGEGSGAPEPQASLSASGSAEPPSQSAAPVDSSTASLAPPAPKHPALPEPDLIPTSIADQRAAMIRRMRVMLRLTDNQVADLEATLAKATSIVGQGNPEISVYAMSRGECRKRRDEAKALDADDELCGAPFMVPVWDPKAGQQRADSKLCIDQFEFPGIPCEYPVTWVSAREAALLCRSIGKRLCDAHEWEGACAGAVHNPDTEYSWNKPRKESKSRHNAEREIIWAYGAQKDHTKCATSSEKTKTCQPSGFKKCGSNTYPAGSFPACVSPFGVFDQHGNAAEHMNLPTRPEQLASRGITLGETEMKGSWFIFQKFEAHDDDCRWRAPDWHGTKVMAHNSHQNYHLGFRCCKDIGSAVRPEPPPDAPAPEPKKKKKRR